MIVNQDLKIERYGSALVLTIDRESRRNALSRDLIMALGQTAREVASMHEVRAVILTGAGSKAFCAGADLKERQGMSFDDVRALVQLYRTELGALDRCPKPVIAAINGAALGGGLELALACDLRISTETASFALPETSLAIIPGAGGTQKLSRIVGEARAKEMILLGQKISAQEALTWGIVNKIVSEQTPLLEATFEWIQPILKGAPIAQAAALEAIDVGLDCDLATGLRVEALAYERTLTSHDRNEALQAFAEKRTPNFSGS